MTPEEITKLAVEYVEELYPREDFEDIEKMGFMRDMARKNAAYLIRWLLRDHDIVKKSNVEKAEQTESAVSGWVCRDEHSDLYVVIGDKPKRTGFGFWENESSDCITLPQDKFPTLTWESEPLEVTITIKPKKKQ